MPDTTLTSAYLGTQTGTGRELVKKYSFGSRGDDQAAWQRWWQSVGSMAPNGDPGSINTLNAIDTAIKEGAGKQEWEDMSETDRMYLVQTAYDKLVHGTAPEKLAGELTKWVQNYTEDGKDYTKGWNQLAADWTNILAKTGNYDKSKYKSADDLKTLYNDYIKAGGDGIGAAQHTIDAVKADYIQGVEDGRLNKQGEAIDASQQNKQGTDIDAIYTKLGLNAPDEKTRSHWVNEMKDNDADEYEIEQLIKTTPEYQKLLLDQQYAEYEPILESTHQAELANINKLVESAESKTTEYFNKEIIPAVKRTALELGGRNDTFTTDAFAKSATDLAKSREDFTLEKQYEVEAANTQRQLAAKSGKFDAARAITTNDLSQNLRLYENLLSNQETLQQRISEFNLAKETNMFQRMVDRQNRDAAKEVQRLNNAQKDAWRAANKKASKYGMFANILQGGIQAGMASGGNPLAIGAGMAAGYGTSYLQQQQNEAEQSGVSLTNTYNPSTYSGFYSDIGKTLNANKYKSSWY